MLQYITAATIIEQEQTVSVVFIIGKDVRRASFSRGLPDFGSFAR
jgi:hypothetical protein